MIVVKKNIGELKPVDGNTRLHNAKQIREYVRSLKMFGQFRPMIVDENNVVLAGNGLLQALKAMGSKTADCYVMSGLSDNEKRKLMLADNKIFQLGEDDTFAFEETLSKLDGDINIPGYGTEFLKNLTSDLKSIDVALNTDGKIQEKRQRKSKSKKDICVCPRCGCEFNRSDTDAEKSKTPLSI